MALLACIPLLASAAAGAAGNDRRQQYRESMEGARANYTADARHCRQDSDSRSARAVCLAQAKAEHKKATAETVAHWRNTAQARTDARIAAADADHDVARARCKAGPGQAQAACLRQAKAARLAATTDARSDLRVTESRNRDKEERKKAYYRAARERCDALAGAAKEACMTLARAQYSE
ncbi:hypothetical protein KTQ42_06210|uniref:hypothetical protein n=1 Tax=Noviherbaspirillum sp. L7-7A TaxID=2850560 RepID=UPI001C2C43A2|nr:hypothetical protein [Noviherbaspirillum sp. L7-7A]MBV0878900.1 hypothetical protein [Noviherbaspirillum sp. L7-7A]